MPGMRGCSGLGDVGTRGCSGLGDARDAGMPPPPASQARYRCHRQPRLTPRSARGFSAGPAATSCRPSPPRSAPHRSAPRAAAAAAPAAPALGGSRGRAAAAAAPTGSRARPAGPGPAPAARFGSERVDWLGSERLGTVREGTGRYGTVQPGTARYGSVRLGIARYGPVRLGTARYGTARHGSAAPQFPSHPSQPSPEAAPFWDAPRHCRCPHTTAPVRPQYGPSALPSTPLARPLHAPYPPVKPAQHQCTPVFLPQDPKAP